MDEVFCFKIDLEPTSATPGANDIAGALAHVWILAPSMETAEIKALAFLMDYAWIVKGITYVPGQFGTRFTPEDLDAIEEHRAQARVTGISVEISAWRKEPLSEKAPVEIRLMGPSLRGGDYQA